MFRKRTKKVFPEGTFIPTTARVLAILQLCLAFTLIAWNAGLPFMGDLFSFKSQTLIYQNISGDPSLLEKLDPQKAVELKQQFQRNRERFKQLPEPEQQIIVKEYAKLQEQVSRTFSEKIKRTISILFLEMPPFELAWIVFSVTISILLLKRVEGAVHAVWLLPIIAGFYLLDNQLYGKSSPSSPDAILFPREEVLIDKYIQTPLSPHIHEQHEQLTEGWKLFLVEEWAKEVPSSDPAAFALQVETGEYAFNLARLEKIRANSRRNSFDLRKKEPLPLLLLYFFWNLYVAYKINKVLRRQESVV